MRYAACIGMIIGGWFCLDAVAPTEPFSSESFGRLGGVMLIVIGNVAWPK